MRKSFWRQPSLWAAFLIGAIYGMVVYWCYMPNAVTCLYCNQPVFMSTDIRVCFDHQNMVHFDCAKDMREMLDLTGKTTTDFLRTK